MDFDSHPTVSRSDLVFCYLRLGRLGLVDRSHSADRWSESWWRGENGLVAMSCATA